MFFSGAGEVLNSFDQKEHELIACGACKGKKFLLKENIELCRTCNNCGYVECEGLCEERNSALFGCSKCK